MLSLSVSEPVEKAAGRDFLRWGALSGPTLKGSARIKILRF